MNIGQAIRQLRTTRGVTQQNLALNTGVTQGFLSLVEKGKREPGFGFVERIAEVLRVPPQLVLLLACEGHPRAKRYSKQLQQIAEALDGLLRACTTSK